MKQQRVLFSLILLFFSSISFSQNYNIYVSDAGNFNNPPWQILKFDENGENGEVFIPEEEGLAWPQDILFLDDQDVVLISNLNTGNINRHNAETGELIDVFADGIGGTTRMKIGPEGLLYVLQWTGNGKVLRYELDGTFVDEFTDTGVTQSIGLDWDADGHLYVSSYGGGYVQEYDTAGVDQGRFIDSDLAGPTNIWFDPDGVLKVSDYNGTSIKSFDTDGNLIGDFITGLQFSEGIAFTPAGNLLIGNGGNSSVKEFTADGTYVKDIVPSGTLNLLTPNAVVLRDVVPSAVSDLALSSNLIYPTVGDQFYLKNNEEINFERVHIYNAAGALIENKVFSDSFIWDAKQQGSGLYFISLITKEGTQKTQSVIVK